jgi:hypothetical protein
MAESTILVETMEEEQQQQQQSDDRAGGNDNVHYRMFNLEQRVLIFQED